MADTTVNIKAGCLTNIYIKTAPGPDAQSYEGCYSSVRHIIFIMTHTNKKFEAHYDGKVITGQKTVKYLGLVLDQNLSGQSMFSQVLSKVNNKMKFMYRYKHCLSVQHKP